MEFWEDLSNKINPSQMRNYNIKLVDFLQMIRFETVPRILASFIIILFFFQFGQTQNRQVFSETPIFENGKNGYACYRIPAIIKAPNGELLAFAEGRVNGCNDFGNVDIVLRRSDAKGNSWRKISKIVDYGKLQAGNPAPVVDMLDPEFPEGRIFLFYNTGNNHEGEIRKGNGLREVWFITSTDNGNTWSTPTNITQSVHRPNNPPKYNFKEDWRSYALTPGHALQLKNPKQEGRIYVPANHSAGPPQKGFNDYRAHGFYSDDHGKSWKLSESVDVPSSNESIAVELSDGQLMQNIRHQNGSQRERLVALSSDGGNSWDTTFFDAQLPSPVCQGSIIDYQLQNKKRALLFSNPNNQRSRKNMTVRASFDDGKTWLISRIIREGESAYSDLVILKNNKIGLLYEHGNDGGIHFAHFNFNWLTNGKNHTDNPFVQKTIFDKNDLAQEFQFRLSPPVISFENILFEKENPIHLVLGLKGTRIHYTLDESEPTELSPLFNGKIVLKKSATLKAKAFHHQCLPSKIIETEFIKLGKIIPIKNINLNRTANKNYQGKGAQGLIDRKKGTTNFKTNEWLGFSGGDLVATIEFERRTSFQKITPSFLSDQNAWIFLPKEIEILISDDGKIYHSIAKKEVKTTRENSGSALHFSEINLKNQQAKFIKILIKNISSIPEWHPGKGTSPWLFIDEIIIE